MRKTLYSTTIVASIITILYLAVSRNYMKDRIVRQKDMMKYLVDKSNLAGERLSRVEPVSSYSAD